MAANITNPKTLITNPLSHAFFYEQNYLLLQRFKIMARILSIDYGKKRVGLAVTDPGQIIATRLTTVPTHTIFDFLNDYFRKENVEAVVVGYPRQMNNEASEAVRYINPFLKKFQQRWPEIKLELFDERFTSKMALQTMIDGGLKKKQRQDKAMVDAVSATIILQNYLERKRNLTE
jgi:putative Holliday junction resolvase